MELGEYDAAANHFRAIRLDSEQFTIGARVARWYELTGHADIARAVLIRAINRVSKRDDLPREQAAWFNYRLGELELRLGNFVAADSASVRARAQPGGIHRAWALFLLDHGTAADRKAVLRLARRGAVIRKLLT